MTKYTATAYEMQESKYTCYYCGFKHDNDSECPECNVINHENDKS